MRKRHSPEFLALQRMQLDSRKGASLPLVSPKEGWIRAVRTALGMSASQLAKRLGISQQAVTKLERSERTGTITLASLAKVAEALECELKLVLVPKSSLDHTMRRRAEEKAREERNRVRHTMRLEAQDPGGDGSLESEKAVQAWMTERIANLWD